MCDMINNSKPGGWRPSYFFPALGLPAVSEMSKHQFFVRIDNHIPESCIEHWNFKFSPYISENLSSTIFLVSR